MTDNKNLSEQELNEKIEEFRKLNEMLRTVIESNEVLSKTSFKQVVFADIALSIIVLSYVIVRAQWVPLAVCAAAFGTSSFLRAIWMLRARKSANHLKSSLPRFEVLDRANAWSGILSLIFLLIDAVR